ncbi:MAG: SH3 domain-containing protein [Betaproteobacteria bacterium]
MQNLPTPTTTLSFGHTRLPWRSLLIIALLLPATAWAQLAFTTSTVNMRAGPDRSFPLVAWLPAGTQVNVIGCINGWSWCDVTVGFNRGWIFGQYLTMSFQNQPIIVGNAGGWLGVPLIAFSVGPYWDIHYRNRPWWNNRNQWVNRPSPPSWGPPPSWRPPPSRPPISQPRPPNAWPPQGARPPGSNPPGGGRPPSSGNPGGGRPASGGNPGGGRPPSVGNPGDGRPPSGDRPQGRPPVSSQGPN